MAMSIAGSSNRAIAVSVPDSGSIASTAPGLGSGRRSVGSSSRSIVGSIRVGRAGIVRRGATRIGCRAGRARGRVGTSHCERRDEPHPIADPNHRPISFGIASIGLGRAVASALCIRRSAARALAPLIHRTNLVRLSRQVDRAETWPGARRPGGRRRS